MLVLSRKVGEELVIGDNIRIVISRVVGNRVSLGIQAPRNVPVIRSELKKIRDEFRDAMGVESHEAAHDDAREDSRSVTENRVRCYLDIELSPEMLAGVEGELMGKSS